MIRTARAEDVCRMLEIYSPYVSDTAISFEYAPPEPAEFQKRFDRITRRFPWIVWEEDGRVLGYAYADAAFERAAYRWDADVSIYIDMDARGRGLGSALYDCLEGLLNRMGYCNLYALITAENAPSCRFHENRGYVLEGVLKRSGYKFGRWYDVNWYCLKFTQNDPGRGQPEAFKPEMLQVVDSTFRR